MKTLKVKIFENFDSITNWAWKNDNIEVINIQAKTDVWSTKWHVYYWLTEIKTKSQ